MQVMVSLTTLDNGLARVMEPRAAAPERRAGDDPAPSAKRGSRWGSWPPR